MPTNSTFVVKDLRRIFNTEHVTGAAIIQNLTIFGRLTAGGAAAAAADAVLTTTSTSALMRLLCRAKQISS
jgi:hypothetical protein